MHGYGWNIHIYKVTVLGCMLHLLDFFNMVVTTIPVSAAAPAKIPMPAPRQQALAAILESRSLPM
jgi:hypothetical protein